MKNILFEVNGDVAKITFNRAQALNALNKETLSELKQVVAKLNEDDSIRFVIFTGINKAFIAGADISEMKDMNEVEASNYGNLGSKIFLLIENLPQITIALINGYCLGGGLELALACDIRIAVENAKFGSPEVTLGITPGFSGTVRLPLLIGVAKAKELLYTGKIIDANEALKIGLVNEVVEKEKLTEKGDYFINILKKNSYNALKNIKAILREQTIEEKIHIENKYFSSCFAHPDQKEGMTAFIEKRKPKYL